MSIAGRLALQSDRAGLPGDPANTRSIGYHGIDIIVRTLSPDGFLAETRATVPEGTRVRLRLPGLGAAHARVLWSEGGSLRAEFANPIGFGRLARIPGFARLADRAMNAA